MSPIKCIQGICLIETRGKYANLYFEGSPEVTMYTLNASTTTYHSMYMQEGSSLLKVMMIDPWGVNNLSMFTNGLCGALENYVELNLYTNYYYIKNAGATYPVERVFFRFSQNMRGGAVRRAIRVLEYIIAYIMILRHYRRRQFDLVHIQWFLLNKVDMIFIKLLKKMGATIIFTAHNVVPHVNGNRYVPDLRRIYRMVDKIIVHGQSIASDFTELFPDYAEKLFVQPHGPYESVARADVKQELIPEEMLTKVQGAKGLVCLFCGYMFYNKGVDRLAKLWLDYYTESEHILIIAGRKTHYYPELEELEPSIKRCNNIIYVDEYINDNLFSFFMQATDLVILPYRHASMSGVIFSAAAFSKAVLCTNVGAFSEYVRDGLDGFIVDNDAESLKAHMKDILGNSSRSMLSKMGEALQQNIEQNFSWSSIAELLAKQVYAQYPSKG